MQWGGLGEESCGGSVGSGGRADWLAGGLGRHVGFADGGDGQDRHDEDRDDGEEQATGA
jgi:hypothetical protein